MSVDTWRAPVARAALEAGAAMINDVSGLSDPELADACAETGAGLVVTHTRLPPKQKGFPAYEDVVDDVLALLGDRGAAPSAGVQEDAVRARPRDRPGQAPAESVELLRRLPELARSGGPCCWPFRARTSSARSPAARPPAATPARWPPSRACGTVAPRSCGCTTWPLRRLPARARGAGGEAPVPDGLGWTRTCGGSPWREPSRSPSSRTCTAARRTSFRAARPGARGGERA